VVAPILKKELGLKYSHPLEFDTDELVPFERRSGKTNSS
jgi:hypothetical protein